MLQYRLKYTYEQVKNLEKFDMDDEDLTKNPKKQDN